MLRNKGGVFYAIQKALLFWKLGNCVYIRIDSFIFLLIGLHYSGADRCVDLPLCFSQILIGVVILKIVVIKSPKVLRGILRMIFKIKKDSADT